MTIKDFFKMMNFNVDDIYGTIKKDNETFWFFDKIEIPPELEEKHIIKVTLTNEKDFDVEDACHIEITCTLCIEFIVE